MNFASLTVLFIVSTFCSNFSNGQNDFPDCDPKCVFKTGNLTSKSVGSFPKNCPKVCSTIYIDNSAQLSVEQLKIAFKNMKKLVGGLEISYTNYKSLDFLAGLQRIESRTGIYISNNDKLEELRLTDLTSINGTSLTISANKNLKRLILPNLKNVQLKNPWSWMSSISISENSRNLCMTLPEAKILLNYKKIDNIYMEGNICNAGNLAKKSCLVPKIGCENLVGDLKIGPKFGFKKVKSLKFLYGSLIVKNSDLVNFKVFPNLLEIVQLNSTKLAIDVQGNKKLQNTTFPKLQRVYSLAINTTTFENNHNSLKKDFKSCYSIRKAIYQGREQFDNDPVFDGLKCEEMQNGGKKKF